MMVFDAALVVATFLCSLVAGLLFAFAIVVMPGIGKLPDHAFIRAFQAIDRVIQNSQPLFMAVWIGSTLAVLAAAVLGLWALAGAERLLMVGAAAIYLVGVQLPTFVVNVPLNNELQRLDVGTMDEPAQQRTRRDFEPRWNRWNAIRTVCACVTSIVLIIVILKM